MATQVIEHKGYQFTVSEDGSKLITVTEISYPGQEEFTAEPHELCLDIEGCKIEQIEANAFAGVMPLSSVALPTDTTLKPSDFPKDTHVKLRFGSAVVNLLGDRLDVVEVMEGKPVSSVKALDLRKLDFTWVGPQAFTGLQYLSALFLPDSVSSIGADAFTCCEQLYYLDLAGADLREIDEMAFSGSGIQMLSVKSVALSAIDQFISACRNASSNSYGKMARLNMMDADGASWTTYLVPESLDSARLHLYSRFNQPVPSGVAAPGSAFFAAPEPAPAAETDQLLSGASSEEATDDPCCSIM